MPHKEMEVYVGNWAKIGVRGIVSSGCSDVSYFPFWLWRQLAWSA